MKKAIRLSYYSYDSLGNPWVSGGGAVRDFEVLKRFAPHAEITLYVGRYPGFKEQTREGVRMWGLGFGSSNWLCRLTFSLAANIRLLFDQSDILGNSASIYAPVLAGFLRGRRFYSVYHHRVGKGSREKFGAWGKVPELLEKWMFRLGRRYAVSNASLAAHIHAVNPSAEVFVTSNGFNSNLLSLPSRPAAPPFILFLGRFDIYMKGLDLLIPAYVKIAAGQGIDLVLAGRSTPEALEKIRQMLPGHTGNTEPGSLGKVRMETDISETRKAELLAACLFFCSPSRFEGFGIAALEANAAGKAVLASDVDGFRASLAFGETALAIAPGDITALEFGLSQLVRDAELREKLGRQGRERAGDFSWDKIAEKEWNWVVTKYRE